MGKCRDRDSSWWGNMQLGKCPFPVKLYHVWVTICVRLISAVSLMCGLSSRLYAWWKCLLMNWKLQVHVTVRSYRERLQTEWKMQKMVVCHSTLHGHSGLTSMLIFTDIGDIIKCSVPVEMLSNRKPKMVPVEMSSSHSYSTSVHTIGLSFTVWPQCTTQQTQQS